MGKSVNILGALHNSVTLVMQRTDEYLNMETTCKLILNVSLNQIGTRKSRSGPKWEAKDLASLVSFC